MLLDKVMYSVFYTTVTVIGIFPTTQSLKNKVKPCDQFSTCKCIFPTGRGINLTPINQNLSVQYQANTSILLHLCENVSFGKVENGTLNQCFNNVSACYVDTNKNQSLSLGKAENMKIISDGQFRPMSIQFNNTGNITNIALTCDLEASEPKLLFTSTEGLNVYNLELQSMHACVRLMSTEEGPSGGLSMGSLLVIMLLVFTLVYFGGGMVALKLLRGAEGREMIPNIDFWMDLPYLVRDGVLFAFNGFTPPASYDRI